MNETIDSKPADDLVLDVKQGQFCSLEEETGEIHFSQGICRHPKPETVEEGIIRRRYFSFDQLRSDLESLARRCGLGVKILKPTPKTTEFLFI